MVKQVKRYKFLGYCSKCFKFISEKDKIGKTQYKCWGCNEIGKLKELLNTEMYNELRAKYRDYNNLEEYLEEDLENYKELNKEMLSNLLLSF